MAEVAPPKTDNETPSSPAADSPSQLALLPICTLTPPLQKFQFNRAHKVLLVKCVRQHDAHRGEHGQLDRKFDPVREELISHLMPALRIRNKKPTIKTLRDKFRLMLKARESAVKETAGAFGIVDERSEMEVLLDHLIAERDAIKEGFKRK